MKTFPGGVAALFLGCLVFAAPVSAQVPTTYQFSNIVDNKTVLPDGKTLGDTPTLLRTPLNDRGEIIVPSPLADTYRTDGASFVRVIQIGAPAPGGGVFTPFGRAGFDLNNSGGVAFTSQVNVFGPPLEVGVYTSDGATTKVLARTGAAAPGGGVYQGEDTVAYPPHINNRNEAAFFFATSLRPRGNIFVGDGNTTRLVVGSGMDAPGGGTFLDFDEENIDDAGNVFFHATTTGGAGWGIFKYTPEGQGSLLVARGQGAPGGGTFLRPAWPSMSASGAFAFYSTMTDGPAQGVYLSDGANLSLIAGVGQTLPGGEIAQGFAPYATLNDSGLVAFAARDGLTRNAAVTGIYVSDGKNATKVIALGDILLGSPVTALSQNRDALNNAGQIAVSYTLADGRFGVALATPVSAAVAGEPLSLCFMLPLTLFAFRRRFCGSGRLRG